MGFLLPALNKARRSGATAACANNLRQFGTAWQMYANNNRGTSCPGRLPTNNGFAGVYDLGEGEEYRPRWYELLSVQFKKYATKTPIKHENDNWTINDPFFLCPSEPDRNNSRNYTYGYNYQFLGNARPKLDKTWINYPVKSTRISPAKTIMAADSMGTAAGKPRLKRTAYYADGTKDIFAWGNKGWAIDPPRLTDKSDYADPQQRAPENRAAPEPRHSRKANVVYCDGHVELMSLEQMGYVVRADESVVATDPRATNRLFSGSGRDEDPPAAQ